MKVLFGCPEPSWAYRQDEIAKERPTLFIAYGRLIRRKSEYPPARVPVCFDSSAFTMVKKHGGWPISPEVYVANIIRIRAELGSDGWIAGQDYPCEADVTAATGLTVREHVALTVDRHHLVDEAWRDLFEPTPEETSPFIPTLQGYAPREYVECARRYLDSGVDLRDCPTVGVGSMCRRKRTDEVLEVVETILYELPYLLGRLHLFGAAKEAIQRAGHLVQSTDSQAAFEAARRRNIRLDGCTHQNCNYCPKYGLACYRELRDVAREVSQRAPTLRPRQLDIFDASDGLGLAS